MPPIKYDIVYLPSAEADLGEILTYIAVDLAAPSAAHRLLDKIEQSVAGLAAFPFAHALYPTHVATAPLEFRALFVGSYIVLYYVSDATVTIARIVYGGRDVQEILRHL